MRLSPALLLVALALSLVGCPKEKRSTTWDDPAMKITAWAVFIADVEGASPPPDWKVEARAGGGAVILAEAPALFIDEPPQGWRRWTRIGTQQARQRLLDPQALVDAAAAGRESMGASLTLSSAGAADPEIRKTLLDAGLALGAVEGSTVPVTVPRGAWGAVLKLEEVASVRPGA